MTSIPTLDAFLFEDELYKKKQSDSYEKFQTIESFREPLILRKGVSSLL